MCVMCCAVGGSEWGQFVSSGRIRVAGLLSRGRRGLLLTTKDDMRWIVDSEHSADDLVGSTVIVDGTVTGLDRLRADWIGEAPRSGLSSRTPKTG